MVCANIGFLLVKYFPNMRDCVMLVQTGAMFNRCNNRSHGSKEPSVDK